MTNFPVELFKNIETPFYYYDSALLKRTLETVKKSADAYGYHIHYAIKANTNPGILAEVTKYGFGVDCVSGGEIKHALEAGFDGNKIMYAGVGKTDKEIEFALDSNIRCFNVESLPELENINEIAARKNCMAHVAMRINPAVKMCPGKEIEKKVVREAFADILPQSVAWRQKEQFSDGAGYSWIDTLKAVTAAAVSDEQMAQAAVRFPINPPRNKEEYFYRSIFEEHFPRESAARSVPSVPSVACSTAEALAWDVSFQGNNDPSGRAVAGVHEEAYKD